MSEETQTTQEAPQLSEVEAQAMELGWRPEEEFKAEPANEGKKWRTAEDFMDRKSLFDKIDEIKRENRDLKKGLTALTHHNAKIEESAYRRAINELRREKRAALEDGDLVKADEISERIDELKTVQVTPRYIQPQPANPAFDQWVAQNKWYVEDSKMQALADGVAQHLVNRGETNPQVIFATVEKEVRETFPHKFRNPRKDTAPNLDVSDKKATGKKAAVDQLTTEEVKIMKTMIRAGVKLSEEEYAKQVLKSRGVQ